MAEKPVEVQESAVLRLMELFRRYARHESTCDLLQRGWINGGRCDCGFEDAEREVFGP